jgi:hypothetical protein
VFKFHPNGDHNPSSTPCRYANTQKVSQVRSDLDSDLESIGINLTLVMNWIAPFSNMSAIGAAGHQYALLPGPRNLNRSIGYVSKPKY